MQPGLPRNEFKVFGKVIFVRKNPCAVGFFVGIYPPQAFETIYIL